jgi:hypothetical protein
MNKCIIAISGTSMGKTLFQEVAEEKLKYHIVGADCGEELQQIIERLGWSGQKDEKYYLFYNELFKIANLTFDFKKKYIERTIADFQNNVRYQILVVRGSDELEKDLENEFGIYKLFIAKNQLELIENELKYDKVILIDNNFEKSVKQTLDILLNKENEKV